MSNDIRLAVDSGKTAIGLNTATATIKDSSAKLIIVAEKSKESNMKDLVHMAKVAGIKIIEFNGNPVELGAVCGKPFSVSAISVIEPGNSNILKDE